MTLSLACRVRHLSMNLSRLHLLLTPRLGAIWGGSGSTDSRRKLMVSRKVVTRWYQATNNTLTPFTPTEPSAMSPVNSEKAEAEIVMLPPCKILAPSMLPGSGELQWVAQLAGHHYTLRWSNQEHGESSLEGTLGWVRTTLHPVGLQGYPCSLCCQP